jgi:hypothetical protein
MTTLHSNHYKQLKCLRQENRQVTSPTAVSFIPQSYFLGSNHVTTLFKTEFYTIQLTCEAWTWNYIRLLGLSDLKKQTNSPTQYRNALKSHAFMTLGYNHIKRPRHTITVAILPTDSCIKTNSVALSPRANYTDWSTDSCIKQSTFWHWHANTH